MAQVNTGSIHGVHGPGSIHGHACSISALSKRTEQAIQPLLPLPQWRVEQAIQPLLPLSQWRVEQAIQRLLPLPQWRVEQAIQRLLHLPQWRVEQAIQRRRLACLQGRDARPSSAVVGGDARQHRGPPIARPPATGEGRPYHWGGPPISLWTAAHSRPVRRGSVLAGLLARGFERFG